MMVPLTEESGDASMCEFGGKRVKLGASDIISGRVKDLVRSVKWYTSASDEWLEQGCGRGGTRRKAQDLYHPKHAVAVPSLC